MQDDHYIELLHKQLAGEINTDEQQQLDDWLAASADHQAQAEEYQEAWRLGGQFSADVPIDLEEDFALLQKRIAADEEQTPAKVRLLAPRRRWLQIAAALLFLLASGWLLRNFLGSEVILMQQVATVEGELQKVDLPDGSTIWLNGRSKLSYPEAFEGSERRVVLDGEAFFDIQKNPNRPFIVETRTSDVRVLGTSFNVRHYTDESFVEVQVKTGKVRMQMKETGDAVELVANEKGLYENSTKALTKQTDESLNALAWQSGQLIFEGQELSEVLSVVERQYNIDIELDDPTLANCTFSNRFQGKSAEEVLNIIAGVLQMTVEKTGPNNYRLLGGSC